MSDNESTQIQKLRLEFLTKTQQLVDDCVYYRNLAITLGAKPEMMADEYDRKLCEAGLIDKQEFSEVIQEKERFWKEWYEQEEKIKNLEARAKIMPVLRYDTVNGGICVDEVATERAQAIAEEKYLRKGQMPAVPAGDFEK